MRKFALLFAVVLMGAAAPALAQSVDDPASAEPVVDPAPSGVELSNADLAAAARGVVRHMHPFRGRVAGLVDDLVKGQAQPDHGLEQLGH